MIRKVKTSIEEQETFFYLAPLEPEGKALVYTTEPTMIKKMWELHKQYPDDVIIKSDDKYGTDFHIPPNWIVIKPKKKLTEAQKRDLAKRFEKRSSNSRKKGK